jgi:hypothetical protein
MTSRRLKKRKKAEHENTNRKKDKRGNRDIKYKWPKEKKKDKHENTNGQKKERKINMEIQMGKRNERKINMKTEMD